MRSSLTLVVAVTATLGIPGALAQQNLRAWHIYGQTFLVWEHSTPTPVDTSTYLVYACSEPITSLDGLSWAQRVFATSGANTRLNGLVNDARWRIPSETGESLTVGAGEALGIITPRTEGETYYAVSLMGSAEFCSVGPVMETTDPIHAHLQFQNEDVDVWAHWIDGREDYAIGGDYPVMGTRSTNGLGFNFALWHTHDSPPTDDLPLVVALHGYGGGFMSCAPTEPFGFYSGTDSAFVATLDDALPEKLTGTIAEVGTFWFGWNNQFDRFDPTPPGPGAVVVDYTARRLWWEIEWLAAHYPVDLDRLSFMGVSMGGFGALVHSQIRADQISAALAFVPVFDVTTLSAVPLYLFGAQALNLPTSLPGAPGFYDLARQSWRLEHREADWPYTMIVCGKNDGVVGWEDKPAGYRHLDSAATGFALYWDERSHAEWVGFHWDASEHLHAEYLAQFSRSASFPAFSATDLDLALEGRQPDPGNGDLADGDPWGTWGGYLEWDADGIQDEPDAWAVTFWIVSHSAYPHDITSADSLRASVTIRRPQAFAPAEDGVRWAVTRVSDGMVMQSGVAVPVDGAVCVPHIMARKYSQRLSVVNGPCIDYQWSGVP